jgi:hypothetical protein
MPQSVRGGEAVVEALDVKGIWDLGLNGKGSRVAVIDTGINPAEVSGAPPVWERDFTRGDDPRDQLPTHGSRVAACIRCIAPDCDLFNAKVYRAGQRLTKAKVAEAVATLANVGVDVINISLDLAAGRCDPTFRPVLGSLGSALMVSNELDRSSACELCLSCWDAAKQGIAVVAAAGNRWGKRMQCPARCPGALGVEATWTSPEERHYFWSSRSWVRRLWEYKILGNVGRWFGTSFSAAYTSGEIALLLPFTRERGWLEARNRIIEKSPRKTLTAVEMLRRLTFHPARRLEGDVRELEHQERPNPESERSVILALARGHLHKTPAGQASAIDALRPIDPSSVSGAHRSEVVQYLSVLNQHVDALGADAAAYMASQDLPQLIHQWGAT